MAHPAAPTATRRGGAAAGRGLFSSLSATGPNNASSALWQQVTTPIRNLVASLLNQLFRGQRTRLLPPPTPPTAPAGAPTTTTTAAAATATAAARSSKRGGSNSEEEGSSSGPRVVTVAGLSNLGNTCFLNSVLQSLATLSPFVDSLARALPPGPTTPINGRHSNEPISPLVLDVLEQLRPQFNPPLPTTNSSTNHNKSSSSSSSMLPSSSCSSPSSPLVFRPSRRVHRPTALLRAFHARCSQLEVHEQQDAEELLQLLVNLISDELSTSASSSTTTTSTSSMKPPSHELPALTSLRSLSTSSTSKPLTGLVRAPSLLPSKPHTALEPSSTPAPAPPDIPFRNPLAGWWASTLQCCACGHRRPVQNSAFIDVPLPLPEAQAILRGQGRNPVRYASLTTTAAAGADGQEACHLMDCLREFASEELVQEVECWSCRHKAQLGAAAAATRRLESAIRNADEANLDGSMDPVLDAFRAELAAVRAREAALRSLNPDDPRAAELFHAALEAGGVNLLAPEEEGALRENGVGRGKEGEGGLRRPARKRLVFSRLPRVLCFHLGRRVFSPALGRMAKARQRVVFPLLMDVSGYAAYGGRMSDDVADGPTTTTPPTTPTPTPTPAALDAPTPAEATDPTVPPSPPQAQATSPHFRFLLQAVVVHHGSADGGHYTTYRRLSPVLPSHAAALLRGGAEGQGLLAPELNTWVHVSDDQVVPAPVEEVLACEAYLLFYQSLESLLTPQTPQMDSLLG